MPHDRGMATAHLYKSPDWSEKLAAYLLQAQAHEFAYGRMDCCLFVANGVRAMTGFDLMAAFRGRYHTEEQIKKIVEEEGATCLTALIRRQLQAAGLQRKPPGFYARGDIAQTNEGALGLIAMDARHAVVLHPEGGTHAIPLAHVCAVWGI